MIEHLALLKRECIHYTYEQIREAVGDIAKLVEEIDSVSGLPPLVDQ